MHVIALDPGNRGSNALGLPIRLLQFHHKYRAQSHPHRKTTPYGNRRPYINKMDKRFAVFAILVFAVSAVFIFQNTPEGGVQIQKDASASLGDWPMFRHDVQRTGNLNFTDKSYIGELLNRGDEYRVVWDYMHNQIGQMRNPIDPEECKRETGLDNETFTRIAEELNCEISTVGSNPIEGTPIEIMDKDDVFDPSPIFVDLNGDGIEELVTWYKNTAKEPGDIVRRYSNKIIALELGKPGQDRGFPGVFKRFPWLEYWEFVLAGEVHTSFAASDLDGDGYPEVVFGSDDGMVYALDNTVKWYPDLTTPKAIPLWDYETGGRVRSTPAIADINHDGKKEVVFGSDDGNFYCLDEKGRLLWKYSVGEKIESSPAVYEGMVFFGSDDGNLYALDDKGELVWRYKTDGKIRSSPMVYNQEVIFGSDDGNLYILSLNGTKERAVKTDGKIRSSPVVYKDRIVSASTDGSLYFVGEGVQMLEIGSPLFATPTSSGQYLLVMDANAVIWRVYETGDGFIKQTFKNFSEQQKILPTSVSLPIGNGFTAGTLVLEQENAQYPHFFIYSIYELHK